MWSEFEIWNFFFSFWFTQKHTYTYIVFIMGSFRNYIRQNFLYGYRNYDILSSVHSIITMVVVVVLTEIFFLSYRLYLKQAGEGKREKEREIVFHSSTYQAKEEIELFDFRLLKMKWKFNSYSFTFIFIVWLIKFLWWWWWWWNFSFCTKIFFFFLIISVILLLRFWCIDYVG